jgi:hypothetical protein
MMLPKIIAQGLAIVSALLDKWVDASATVAVTSNCYDFTIYNVTMTDCGTEFVDDLAELIAGIVALTPDLLGGLFAFSY